MKTLSRQIDAGDIKSRLHLETFLQRRYGTEFHNRQARCLFADRHEHGDAHPSMLLSRNGQAVKCLAGDHLEGWADCFKVLQLKEGLPFTEAKSLCAKFAGVDSEPRSREILATYDYTNDEGSRVYQVVRYEPKAFRQRRPDGHGGWIWNLDGVQRVLYQLPSIRADTHKLLIFHEGEKAVQAAMKAGLLGCHTTTGGGAEAASLTDFSEVAGRDIVICPDHDAAGEKYATAIARLAKSAGARSVKVLRLPGLREKGDIVDWFAGGGTVETFTELVNGAIPFPALKGGGQHEREFCPLPVSDFMQQGEGHAAMDWVLDEYLPVGGLALLAGKPKEGKTTLCYELAVKVAHGVPFLNRRTRATGVLILALEEHPRDVRLRLQALGAESLPNLYIWPGRLDPTPETFERIERFVVEYHIGLMVFDTLGAFWGIGDENDAALVTKAVKPLLALSRDTGTCVLLIHHARKSEGAYGDEIRGSGALFAFVDVALILKRHEVRTQRLLQAVSRYPETPAEVVVELAEDGYKALGDPAQLNRAAKRDRVKGALSRTPQLPAAIAKLAGVALRDIYRLLTSLYEAGEADRNGSGKKGHPFQYLSSGSLGQSGEPESTAEMLFHAPPRVYRGSLHERESGNHNALSCVPPSPCMKENPLLDSEEVVNLDD